MVSNTEVESIYSHFDALSDDSRIWVWQADRELSEVEVGSAQSYLNGFVQQWTSHSLGLKAQAIVAHNRFIIVALDEAASNAASGCSIDSLRHAIEAIQPQLGVDLMGRTQFCFWVNDCIRTVELSDLASTIEKQELNSESLVFNQLIKTKGELKAAWLVPVGTSWHKRFM